MTNKKEIELKIAQNECDQSALIVEEKRLQSKLAALAKPELRHGDYGLDLEETEPFICIGENVFWLGNEGDRSGFVRENWLKVDSGICLLGNLADDLAALAEHASLQAKTDCHDELVTACKCARTSIDKRLICGKGEDPETERGMILALIDEALAKAKKLAGE